MEKLNFYYIYYVCFIYLITSITLITLITINNINNKMNLCKAILNYDMETIYKNLDDKSINSSFTFEELTGTVSVPIRNKYSPIKLSIVMRNTNIFKLLLDRIEVDNDLIKFILDEKYNEGLNIIFKKNLLPDYLSYNLSLLPNDLFEYIIKNDNKKLDYSNIIDDVISICDADKLKIILNNRDNLEIFKFYSSIFIKKKILSYNKKEDIMKLEKIKKLKNLFLDKRNKFYFKHNFLPKNILDTDDMVITFVLCCKYKKIPKCLIEYKLVPLFYT